eukprot:TRINITY_DN11913_c0_g1_i5.p3 TRINITY_DN11913_c0_g1~~TRINITY_DN11913_c0_g1_i5.p3  ORF type:complete len:134 (+),score=24.68 TRINITY_DN11913_c0_g1_i5:657-1058(+)
MNLVKCCSQPTLNDCSHLQLSQGQLTKLLKSDIVPVLKRIFKGKEPSWRHTAYRKKGEERKNLRYAVRMGCFDEAQQTHILNMLTAVFCKKDSRYSNYVMDVLMPEAVERLYSHVLKIDLKTAAGLVLHTMTS